MKKTLLAILLSTTLYGQTQDPFDIPKEPGFRDASGSEMKPREYVPPPEPYKECGSWWHEAYNALTKEQQHYYDMKTTTITTGSFGTIIVDSRPVNSNCEMNGGWLTKENTLTHIKQDGTTNKVHYYGGLITQYTYFGQLERYVVNEQRPDGTKSGHWINDNDSLPCNVCEDLNTRQNKDDVYEWTKKETTTTKEE